MRGLFLLCSAVLAIGCGPTRCEDLVPVPIEGSYRGGGALGEDRLLGVTLEASPAQVVLTYRDLDGSRIRAIYQVTRQARAPSP